MTAPAAVTLSQDRAKRRSERQLQLRNEGFRVRYVTIDDISEIEVLARTVYFDVGVKTMTMLFELYPPGWELIVNKEGEIVSFAALTRMRNGACFGNLIVVKDEYRNKGLIRLFKNDGKTDLACATHFSITKIAYPLFLGKILEFIGILRQYKRITPPHPPGVQVQAMERSMLPAVLQYDRSVAPAIQREQFLAEWITADKYKMKTFCTVALEGNSMRGYAVAREYPRGMQLMPLYADSPEIAESLIAKLTEVMPLGCVTLMQGFSNNRFINQLAKEMNLTIVGGEYYWRNEKTASKEVFNTAQMDKMYFTHEFFPF